MSQPAARRAARSPSVALLPGRSTTSVSPGTAWPGSRMRKDTMGSAASGSRSSKLAIRGRRGTTMRTRRAPARRSGQAQHVLLGQVAGGVAPGDRAQRGQAGPGVDDRVGAVEEAGIAAELVHDVAGEPGPLLGLEQAHRAHELGDHAAALDVADQSHGRPGPAGEAHVGDVALAQVHLGRAASTLDQDEVGAGGEPGEALQHARHELRLEAVIVTSTAAGASTLPCTTTCAPVSLSGFSRTGFMSHQRRRAAGPRLERLRPTDLAAVGGDGGVVAHVLRLERQDAQAAAGEGTAQPGREQGLAGVGAGALQHDGAHGGLMRERPDGSKDFGSS